MKQAYLEAGKIRTTHGLSGEVKTEIWLDGENPLAGITSFSLAPRDDAAVLEIGSCRRRGDIFLVTFRGIDSIEKAQPYKGKTLYVNRRAVDPNDQKIFFCDLIGLSLCDAETKRAFGTITAVENRGAGELFLVRLPDGKTVYFPVIRAWIASMDPEKGVFVHAPEGIFD